MDSERTNLKVTTLVRKGLTLRVQQNMLFLAGIALFLPVLLILPFPLLRVPLGLGVIFFAPGNALMNALFHPDSDLSFVERWAISFGLSLAILPVLALLLDKLPWGIQPWPIAISLSIWTSFFYSVAAIRSRTLEAVNEEPRLSRLHPLDWWRRLDASTRRKAIIACIALTCLFIAAGYAYNLPDPTRHFTEFYMLGPNGLAEDFPHQAAPGQEVSLKLGISNHEGARTRYWVEVYADGQQLKKLGSITLDDGVTWEWTLGFSLAEVKDDQKIEILLFRNQDTTPYRRLQLWLNVQQGP